MQYTRWALICASLLAAFQAWLWFAQDSLLALAAALALAVGIVTVVLRPGSRFALVVNRAWTLPRAEGESERHYRFKIALGWSAVAAICAVGCIAVRGMVISDAGGIVLRVFGFVALLMALQSFLAGWVAAPGRNVKA